MLNTEAVSDHFLIPEDAPDDGHMVDWEKPVVGEVAQDVAYFLAPTTTIWSTDFVFHGRRTRRVRAHVLAGRGRALRTPGLRGALRRLSHV